MKPRCILNKVVEWFLGHSHSPQAEVIAKEVKAALDPADDFAASVLSPIGPSRHFAASRKVDAFDGLCCKTLVETAAEP
jgi:hypothetical protein